jgi:soluble lytic murein transglycosylase
LGLVAAIAVTIIDWSALAQAASSGPPRAVSPLLSDDDHEFYVKAFKAADDGDWDEVRRLVAQGKDPLANKVLRWLELQQSGTAQFEDITAFIDANPDWPAQDSLIRGAEEALVDRSDDTVVMAWFALHEPVTVDGAIRYAEALFRANERTKAIAIIRETWHSGAFGDKQEAQFAARYKQFLTKDDNARRIDRLIWDGRYAEARRILRRADEKTRALADARIRLATMARGAGSVLNRVPETLHNDAGLLFERMRWRRRNGQIDGAIELMHQAPADLSRPQLWWNEREIIIRRAMMAGRMKEAYSFARDHQLSPGPASYAEAEFIAGWIALRHLGEPAAALAHFTSIHEAARFPVTLARGAYWAGRAADAMGETSAASTWYRKAAQYPTTYYGQLAQAKLAPEQRPTLPPPPEPTAAERHEFERSELTRAARLLHEFGSQDQIKPFLLRQVTFAETAAQHVLAAELALSLDRPDLAVSLTKRSAQHAGVILPEQGWPTLPYVTGDAPERALVLATIRQESAFEVNAISRSGARGMMQLMPATARVVAKHLGIAAEHNDRRLLDDPQYNIQLGRTYLERLVGEFDGSYVLALAAYNAGPGRVRQWLREQGDPRQANVDVIDWIEQIPFEETRNYIQRVMENLQVYRHLLGSQQLAQGLSEDLRRGAN